MGTDIAPTATARGGGEMCRFHSPAMLVLLSLPLTGEPVEFPEVELLVPLVRGAATGLAVLAEDAAAVAVGCGRRPVVHHGAHLGRVDGAAHQAGSCNGRTRARRLGNDSS